MSASDVGIESPDQKFQPAPRRPLPRGSRGRAALVAALAVLLVLGLIACAYLVFRLAHRTEDPLNPVDSGPSVTSDTQRHQASAVAEQFALRMDNVDGAKFDAYVAKIKQLLTTKAKSENAKVFSAMAKTYEAAKITGTGKVLLSGIADIDADSATVLVAHDASVKTPQGTIAHHYRWNVDLAKVKGHWLVDSFSPVS